MTKEVIEPDDADGPESGASVRSYRSPLRERQATQTREAILYALAEEILESGIHGLSIAAVAARADVAERTVYRHFANVDALIAGLNAWVGQHLEALLGDQPRLRADRPATIDELLAHLPALYVALDQIGAPARAGAVITLARGSDVGRRGRRDVLAAALAPELAHLDPAAAHAIVETLYLLGGSISWFLLTRNGELDGAQAGQAAERAIHAILRDLRAERRA